jgi:hypothetical protein
MSQAMRIACTFLAFLAGISTLHGWLNLRWFEENVRESLTVAHLPVT